MEKSFKAVCGSVEKLLWGFNVKVPHEITKAFLESTGNRVVCSIGEVSFHCALQPNGPGKRRFILINKVLRKQLKLNPGDEVEVFLKTDSSKYGMPVCEEMTELLYQDPEFDSFFHKLTPGKQRSLLYMIGKPTRSETRLIKALIVSEYLKENNGKLDFPSLQQAFKDRKNDF